MLTRIKMPNGKAIEAKLACVVSGNECACVCLRNPIILRDKLLEFSDMEMSVNELIDNVQQLIFSYDRTEEACHAYIVIVELIRKFLPGGAVVHKTKRILDAEKLVAALDNKIKFR